MLWKERHQQFLSFTRKAVQVGANRVMKKAGFKRPGGGRSFVREVGPFHQVLDYAANWHEGEVGVLWLHLTVTARGHKASYRRAQLPLDVESGDPSDLSVWLCAWILDDALAWFDLATEQVRNSPVPPPAPLPPPRPGEDLPF